MSNPYYNSDSGTFVCPRCGGEGTQEAFKVLVSPPDMAKYIYPVLRHGHCGHCFALLPEEDREIAETPLYENGEYICPSCGNRGQATGPRGAFRVLNRPYAALEHTAPVLVCNGCGQFFSPILPGD